MRILLTGGAGYIGSHTALELLRHGHEVVIADDFSNSSPDSVKAIEKETGRKVKLYACDVSDKRKCETIFRENKVDAVIHFAGFKAVGESVAKPLAYFRNNFLSAITVLECMQESDVNLFVFSSSATVYGTCQDMPLVESSPLGVTSPYGRTKLVIEQMCSDVCRANPKFKAVMLRYFNPIGADDSLAVGENPKGIPNNLMPYLCKVASGELDHLSIFGKDYDTPDGTCIRDFIHISDLASGHMAAVEKSGKLPCGISFFNLGTGKGTSVDELVGIFNKVNGNKVRFVYVDRRAGDVPVSYADASKANEVLGWKAVRSLEDACRTAYAYQMKCKRR